MSQASSLVLYASNALSTFQVHTLRTWKMRTRVTLLNKSHQRAEYATDLEVDARINYPDGRERLLKKVVHLPVGGRIFLEIDPLVEEDFAGEALVTLSLIPRAFYGASEVSVSRDQVWFLLTAQDHQVEYYRPDGFSAGVLYQSGAINYPKFTSEFSAVLQAPKIYFSKNIRTFISVIYNHFGSDTRPPARLQCALVHGSSIIDRWTEILPPKSATLLDFSSRVPPEALNRDDDRPAFFGLYGLCRDSSLIPLTLTVNQAAGTLGIEHSLPPNYYASKVTGAVRKQALVELSESKLFNGTGPT